MNPELKSVYDELQTKVAELVQNFWAKLSKELEAAAATNAAPQPAGVGNGSSSSLTNTNLKNLPWFQHGVRGFLRKLWYGNHPENPTYRNLPNEQVVGKLTLREYTEIKQELVYVLEENSGASGLVGDLANQIMALVGMHLQKAYEIGGNQGKTAQTAEPIPTPPTNPTPEPQQPHSPVDAKDMVSKSDDAQSAAPPTTVTNTDPVAAPEAQVGAKPPRKKRAPKTLTPITTRDDSQTNTASNIEDAVLEFITGHAQNDKVAMEAALNKAGVKFLGKARIEGLPILVRMVHKMSQDNDLGLERNDWIEPAKYKEIFGRVFNLPQLRKAISDLHKELESNQVHTQSNFDNVAAANSDHDPFADHTLPERTNFYVNLLKEGNVLKPKYQLHIDQAKTLDIKEKINYFKECLK